MWLVIYTVKSFEGSTFKRRSFVPPRQVSVVVSVITEQKAELGVVSVLKAEHRSLPVSTACGTSIVAIDTGPRPHLVCDTWPSIDKFGPRKVSCNPRSWFTNRLRSLLVIELKLLAFPPENEDPRSTGRSTPIAFTNGQSLATNLTGLSGFHATHNSPVHNRQVVGLSVVELEPPVPKLVLATFVHHRRQAISHESRLRNDYHRYRPSVASSTEQVSRSPTGFSESRPQPDAAGHHYRRNRWPTPLRVKGGRPTSPISSIPAPTYIRSGSAA